MSNNQNNKPRIMSAPFEDNVTQEMARDAVRKVMANSSAKEKARKSENMRKNGEVSPLTDIVRGKNEGENLKKYLKREIIMPKHLNSANTLFGGQALAWIDKEAAIYAACKLKTSRLVTKIMGECNFVAPAHLGDVVEIGCEVTKYGNTSITLSVEMRNKTTGDKIVTVENIVFVSLDGEGKPTPHGRSE